MSRYVPTTVRKPDRKKAGLNPMTVGLVAAVFVAGGMGYHNRHKPIPLDGAKCRADGALVSSTLVLVDATDPLTETQRRDVKVVLDEAEQDTPRYGKFTLVFLQGRRAFDLQERVSLCNPSVPARDAEDGLNRSRRNEMAMWRASFGRQVDAAVADLGQAPAGETSPIAEGVLAATLRTDFNGQVPRRRLILVSDLMQRSDLAGSFYTIGSATAAATGLRAAGQPDLGGAEIELILLQRPELTMRQISMVAPAWCGWLRERGARSVSVNGAACPVPASGRAT